jgi:phosphatidate cytidylyltransferase
MHHIPERDEAHTSAVDDVEPPPGQPRRRLSNLTVRVLTGVVLLPVALAVIVLGGWALTAVVLLVAVIGTLETYAIVIGKRWRRLIIPALLMVAAIMLAYHFNRPSLAIAALIAGSLGAALFEWIVPAAARPRPVFYGVLTAAGVLYAAFPLAFLIAFRAAPGTGLLWMVVVMGCTMSTDTFAYVGGNLWGRRKLAPQLSPKKTVEGAAFGIFGGIVISGLFLLAGGAASPLTLPMIVIAPFLAIAGDLFESAFKRGYNVKDSHLPGLNLFPGHGGVLDRADSLLVVSTFCYLYLTAIGVLHT